MNGIIDDSNSPHLYRRRDHGFRGCRPRIRGRRDAAGPRGVADVLRTLHNRQSSGPHGVGIALASGTRAFHGAYLQTRPLAVSPEGGLIGIPRNVSMNFQAWREGPNVWICTRNRIGPVYQFVFEEGRWRFDGPIAILRQWGEIVRTSELPDGASPVSAQKRPARDRRSIRRFLIGPLLARKVSIVPVRPYSPKRQRGTGDRFAGFDRTLARA